MSQETLADTAGLHRPEVSRLERGRREPTLETLVALARALGMTPSELLDGLDPDKPCARPSPDPLASAVAEDIQATRHAFAFLLRALRLDRDISQVALAEAAGLHRTYISLIERGQRGPKLETLVALARALGMTPSELLDGLDPDKLSARQPPHPDQKAKPKRRIDR